jgi:uncharacterized protein YjbI with pentapeptide repeats
MILTGYEAIKAAEENTSIKLNKYADPTEGEAVNLTIGEALDIADEDPSLVWCEFIPVDLRQANLSQADMRGAYIYICSTEPVD